MSSFSVTENGVIEGSLKTAGSNVLSFEAAGTFDGATVSIGKYMGQGNPSGVNDPDFYPAESLTSTSVGKDGKKLTIGNGSKYIIQVSGGGASLNVNVVVKELVGEPS